MRAQHDALPRPLRCRLCDDLDSALVELRAEGVETDDEVSESAVSRYAHVVAPDGRLYELVERR
ncbi:MAG: VOC family protein [Candidatus Nanopelagicales bacterium]